MGKFHCSRFWAYEMENCMSQERITEVLLYFSTSCGVGCLVYFEWTWYLCTDNHSLNRGTWARWRVHCHGQKFLGYVNGNWGAPVKHLQLSFVSSQSGHKLLANSAVMWHMCRLHILETFVSCRTVVIVVNGRQIVNTTSNKITIHFLFSDALDWFRLGCIQKVESAGEMSIWHFF